MVCVCVPRPVTPDELKAAVSGIDPELDNVELERIVCWAFRVDTPQQYPECEAIEQSALIARLQQGNLKRAGKKP